MTKVFRAGTDNRRRPYNIRVDVGRHFGRFCFGHKLNADDGTLPAEAGVEAIRFGRRGSQALPGRGALSVPLPPPPSGSGERGMLGLRTDRRLFLFVGVQWCRFRVQAGDSGSRKTISLKGRTSCDYQG